MEGRGQRNAVKTNAMLVGILMLGLILAQTQVEAKSCCRSTTARNCYNVCRLGTSRPTCAKLCDCKIITEKKCPKDYPKISTPQDSDAGEEEPYKINCPTTAARNSFKMCLLTPVECAKRFGCSLTPGDVTHYCKLGCASSVCRSTSTLHNTDAAAAEEAVEHCNHACSEFCTKGTNIAMVTA